MAEAAPTGCRDECGAKSDNPANEGWYYLEAQQKYRCPQCARALAQMNQQQVNTSHDQPQQ